MNVYNIHMELCITVTGVKPYMEATEVEPCTKSHELTKSHSNHCHEPPLNWPAPWPHIRKIYSPNYPPCSTLTNYLMPPSQQEFSLSWDYKNWLLIHERSQLFLEPACCSNNVSCFNKLYTSLILPHVWRFFSNLCADHDNSHLNWLLIWLH